MGDFATNCDDSINNMGIEDDKLCYTYVWMDSMNILSSGEWEELFAYRDIIHILLERVRSTNLVSQAQDNRIESERIGIRMDWNGILENFEGWKLWEIIGFLLGMHWWNLTRWRQFSIVFPLLDSYTLAYAPILCNPKWPLVQCLTWDSGKYIGSTAGSSPL